MPTVMRIGQYRFLFYSDEKNEPPHIHVRFDDTECKFWLEPILLAKNNGVPACRLHEIEKLVYENEKFLKEKYYEFHSE